MKQRVKDRQKKKVEYECQNSRINDKETERERQADIERENERISLGVSRVLPLKYENRNVLCPMCCVQCAVSKFNDQHDGGVGGPKPQYTKLYNIIN